MLEGNTSVKGNLATTGGTAIDSSSAGSIAIGDEATVEFHAETSAPGMAIVSGGKLEYGLGDAHAYLLAVTLKHSHSHINALVNRYAHTHMRSY